MADIEDLNPGKYGDGDWDLENIAQEIKNVLGNRISNSEYSADGTVRPVGTQSPED